MRRALQGVLRRHRAQGLCGILRLRGADPLGVAPRPRRGREGSDRRHEGCSGMNGFPDERRRIIIGAAAAVGVIGLLFGGWLWWQARTQVTTDDAYVEGAVTVISAKVSGNISEMLVKDNQSVKVGDPLVRVDPRDYRAKRDQAAAAVAVAGAVLLTPRPELPMTRGVTAAQGDDARRALQGPRAAPARSEA